MSERNKGVAWIRVIICAVLTFVLFVGVYEFGPVTYELIMELQAHSATVKQLVANNGKDFDSGVIIKVKAFAEPIGSADGSNVYDLYDSRFHSPGNQSIRAICKNCIFSTDGAEYIGVWRKYPEGNYLEVLKIGRFSMLSGIRR